MYRVLQIPRSTYYESHNTKPSRRETENKKLESIILDIYNKSDSVYGTPKIHKELLAMGYSSSIKRVQRLMKKLSIKSIVSRKFKPFPSNIKVEERTNILKQDFSTTKLNEKWVGDITYIHTVTDGWCYLASVMDLYSRKIIGYAFSKTMETSVAIDALNNAYSNQKPIGSVIFHSDLGTKYTSSEFINTAKKYKMKISNSRKAFPYDNACIESFHSILQKCKISFIYFY